MRYLCLVVLGLVLFASGCGDRGEPAAIPGTLRFAATASLSQLDPHRARTVNDGRIIECLYEPLLRQRSDDLTIDPGVAERWDVSDDGLTWTFHLREDAKWSDGQPVTADDFRFAFRRMLLPDTSGYYASLFFAIKGAQEFYNWRQSQLTEFAKGSQEDPQSLYREALRRFDERVGVEAPDARTLVVHLTNPVPYLEGLLAFSPFSPLPQHVLEPQTQADPTTGRASIDSAYFGDPAKLVTNGPYVLKQWLLRDSATLEANPFYWDRKSMQNERVIQYEVSDPIVAVMKYDRGELDWLPDVPTGSRLASQLVNSKRTDVASMPASATYYYEFNVQPVVHGRKNPLADARVRRALSMAIDRQTIVDRVTRMHQPVARTLVPVGAMPGYDPPVEAGVSYDIAEARRLLAEAGYPGGQGLDGLTIMINNGGGHELPAQFIKRTWEKELGVRVGIEALEWSMHNQRRDQGDFWIARAGWFADYQDPMTFLELFEGGNSSNQSGYANPQYDALIEQSRHEPDPAKRLAILRRAEAILVHDQPLAPIYQYTNLHLFRPDQVKHLNPNPPNARRLEWVEVTNGEEEIATDEHG